MITIGMDVHVRNSYVHAVDDQGRVLVRGRCGNTLAELSERLAPAEWAAHAAGQPVRVVLESTTNSRGIVHLLQTYGQAAGLDLTAEVLDARRLRIIADSVNKTDRLDGAVLCELAGSNLKLPTCYVPDAEVFALREHLRARADLVRLRTMLKNRVHAVLHRRNLLTPRGDLFAQAGRTWLAQLDLDAAGRSILDRYLEQLDRLNESIQGSTRELTALAGTPRWKPSVALARTMPGVGLITALTVLAELGDLSRFRSRASVSHYAGLTPRQHDSNDRHRPGHITHCGSAHLRAVLVEAAWVSIPRAPAYDQMYQRIKTRRGGCVAVVAVARRMLEDLFTMLTKQEAFRHSAPRPQATVAPSVAG
jgi:transposase